MEHVLKINDRWWSRLRDNTKRAELRLNDRDYQCGDTIMFEFNGVLMSGNPYIITHVLQGVDGLQEGYCVLSIKKQS